MRSRDRLLVLTADQMDGSQMEVGQSILFVEFDRALRFRNSPLTKSALDTSGLV